ncbi:MAG TPA: rRNA adenine N-6-methyltransferase family protein [Roseiarcus sp.]|nr:rRNA adenine N-6-methyltransferase family protein [Roseiarcus sp.]
MTIGAEAEDRAQFMLLMRAKGVRDLALLRALERAPRALFVPQRYADIAGRDIALPIGCGQTASPPSMVATMIAALALEPHHSVLEIGTGAGYATALIAQLAGQVLTIERCQSLALEAAARLESFGATNVRVAWADALGETAPAGPFDRILVHALIEEPFEQFTDRLGETGALVAARMTAREDGGREQRLVKIARQADGWQSEDIGPARSLAPLAIGLSRGL